MNSKKERKEIFNFKYTFYDVAKWLHFPFGLILFPTRKIYYNEEAKKKIKGGALIISNHSAISDIIVLSLAMGARRLFFVAAKECFDTWIKNLFFKLCLCIEINRENVDTKTMRIISKTMKKGHLVGIFPEGKLNISNEQLQQFHSGPVLMAAMAGVPIVPVYRVPHKRSLFKRNDVVIGEQININKYCAGIPSMYDIERISKDLMEYEMNLIKFYEGVENGTKH